MSCCYQVWQWMDRRITRNKGVGREIDVSNTWQGARGCRVPMSLRVMIAAAPSGSGCHCSNHYRRVRRPC